MPTTSASTLPLVHELSPAPDAWDICRRLRRLPHLLFLDSANRDEGVGRYSFITADPFCWIRSWQGQIDVEHFGPAGSVCEHLSADPIGFLARQLSRYQARRAADLPPFQGGAAGLFGYDLCHHLEHLPRPIYDEFKIPDLAMGLYDWVIAFDHCAARAWIVSTGYPEPAPCSRTERAAGRLRDVLQILSGGDREKQSTSPSTDQRLTPLPQSYLAPTFALPGVPGVWSNFAPQAFQRAVARGVEYVHAGDCFQVNLSQRLLYSGRGIDPFRLYDRLRRRNAAPFAAYLDLGDFVIASASPERFLRVQDRLVQTRPIKGTRPRAEHPAQDRCNAAALLASEKDRAENIMIVDLLRNDLGRVCAYGSIAVEALCRLESYRYVHHLVSVVRGQLRPGATPLDLLRAAFPGGSVTGAPKIRAMQIIAELEPTARGPYCGSLGYLGFDGTLDSNLLIRTFTIGRGWIQFPVGGGIVAESDPEGEYAETLHKAKGMLRALFG